MKRITADIQNSIFILRCIYKSGKVVFAILLLQILFEAAWTYIGTNIGLWIFEAVSVVSVWKTILFVGVIYGITMLVEWLLGWLGAYTYPAAMTRITEYIMNELIVKIFDIRQSDVEDSEFYDRYSRAISEVHNRPGEILKVLQGIIGGMLQLITIIIVVANLNIVYMLAFVFASLICTSISVFLNEIEYERYESATKVNRKLSYINRVIYQPEYGRMLRCNIGYRSLLTSYFSEDSNRLREIIRKYRNKQGTFKMLYDTVYLICFCFTPWVVSIVGLYNNILTMGEITVIMGATAYLPEICNGLFGAIISIRKQSLYINNLRAILDYKTGNLTKKPSNVVAQNEGHIDARSVTFSYNASNPLILREVDLKLKKGEKVALVGPNGAGTTTFACLLAGLYSPSEGYIYLSGESMDKMSLKSISERVLMINQDTKLLSFSVAESVLQRPLYTLEDYELVEEALKRVGMYEKISSLKNGLDTYISKEFDNDGITLSGGEAQKLAIARIYASEAEIVIMDEPTSSLDPMSENEIIELLFDVLKERTMIIISHRLSSVTSVDNICYMNNGQIVERGTHTDLLKRKGCYYELYKAQADKYQGV